MANRYWVGGSNSWDGTAGSKWALTSGGAGGQAVPTSADTVFFDAASGASTVTIGAGTAICSTLTMTGFTGTLAFGTNSVTVAGTGTIYTGDTTYSVSGTPLILITNTSSTARTINPAIVTEANSISFNVNAGSGVFRIQNTHAVKNLTFSGTFTGSFGNNTNTIYGNLTLKTGITVDAGTATRTFAATSGTQQITSAALTLDFPITFSGTATYQLQDAVTVGATRIVTLTTGTLDLNNLNLSCGFFSSSSNTNIRTLAFGTGQIYLTGNNGTIWGFGSITGSTVTGSQIVNATYSGSVGTRTINNSVFANGLSFNITAGSDTVGFLSTGGFNNVNFTGFTGNLSNVLQTVYGNLTISSGMTCTAGANTWTFGATSSKTITTNANSTIDFPWTFNGVGGTWQLQDALTIGATRIVTLTNGTVDLNNNNFTCGFFAANNTNTRGVLFGTGQFYLTGNSGNIWRTDDVTNMTITGTNPTINATYSGSTGTRTIVNANTAGQYSKAVNLNVTAGSDIVTSAGNAFYKNVNFTGYTGAATFSGYVTGNLTLGSGMTNTSVNAITFLNYTGTQTVTSNAVTIDNPTNFGQRVTLTGASGNGTTVTVTYAATIPYFYPVGSTINISAVVPATYNGTYTVTATTLTSVSFASTVTDTFVSAGSIDAGTTVQLQDAMTVGSTRTTALNSGTLNLNNFNYTTGLFTTNVTSVRGITTGTGVFYATGNNATVFNLNTLSNFTLTGTLNVYCTYTGSVGARAIQGFGGTTTILPNFYINAGTDAFQITGSRSYGNLDFTGFGGSLTVTGSNFATVYGNLVSPTVAGASTIANILGFTFAGSGTKTVSFSGLTYDMPFSFATGTYVFQDAMTLGATNGTLTFSSGTLQLKASTTNTVASFVTSGTAAKFLRSTTTGTQATLSQATGTVTATYLNIQDSNATGGAIFDATAATNTNSGNNTGWIFLSATVLEASTAADIITAILTLSSSITEPATLNDSESVQANFNSSATEPIASSETESVQANFNSDITESSILADSSNFTYTISVNITESISFGDSTLTISIINSAITEALGSADSQSYLAIFSGLITEPATLNDSESTQANFNSSTTETATLADSESVQANFKSSTTEPSTLADSESAQASFNSSTTEPSTLADSETAIKGLNSSITENSGIANTQTVTAIFTGTLAEATTLADAETIQANLNSAITEALRAAESESTQVNFQSAITENAGLTDTEAAIKALTSAITEALTSADSQNRQAILFSNLSEVSNLADLLSVQANFNSQITENLVSLDEVIGRGWFGVVDSQTVTWTSINNGQTVTWQNIGDDQNPNWQRIDNTQE